VELKVFREANPQAPCGAIGSLQEKPQRCRLGNPLVQAHDDPDGSATGSPLQRRHNSVDARRSGEGDLDPNIGS
jgi:hypothetical protein